MTDLPLLAAIAFSIAMIGLLWRSDPKRRRVAGLPDIGGGSSRRRLVVAAALLPGIVPAAHGDSAAFLIWFGSCAIAGWLVSQLGRPRAAE